MNMDINNLAEKYINKGITWLTKFLDTYRILQKKASFFRCEDEFCVAITKL